MTDTIIIGDCLEVLRALPADSVHCCVSSPPYHGLRRYGDVHGQIGMELLHDCLAWARGEAPCDGCFVCVMRKVYAEVWRVLRPDGTAWINLGDCYAGSGKGPSGHNGIVDQAERQGFTGTGGKAPPGLKPKDLELVPARVALALQADGWWVRSEIAWCKSSAMPESVDDRPVSAHEKIFLLSKRSRYFYDADAVRDNSTPIENAHFSKRELAASQDPAKFQAMKGWASGHADLSVNQGKGAVIARKDSPRLRNPLGANLRNYWVLGPEPFAGGHHATFPTKIPFRCISAGTSEYGACSKCGAPWQRILEPTEEYSKHLGKDWADDERDAAEGRGHFDLGDGRQATQRRTKRKAASLTAEYRTTGWKPTCKHAAAPVEPCVVLDPFSGAGTTAMVARRLGRRAIGIELNPEYAEISRKRIDNDAVLGAGFPDIITFAEFQARNEANA